MVAITSILTSLAKNAIVKTDTGPRRKPRKNKTREQKKNQCEIYANLSLLVTAWGFLLFCIDILNLQVGAYLDSSDYNLVF